MPMTISKQAALAAGVVAALSLAACGGSPAPEAGSVAAAPAEPAPVAAQTEADAAAALEARETELKRREAELALAQREQDLARRESELAAQEKQRAAKVAAAARKPAPTVKPAVVAAAPVATHVAAPAPAAPVTVPAGTQLSIGLSSPVSTKTASIGDVVDARLTSDLVVEGRRAVQAGAPVRGRVTEVVSGSRKIGGTPTLAMNFDGIELEDGSTVAISGKLLQQGKSDNARDTAKIVGGTAAGAIIGHQIDDDKGTVIGGLLGGAAGAIAARKTGTEIDVPAGTVMAFVLDQPFEVAPN
jgi:hypothetical protein